MKLRDEGGGMRDEDDHAVAAKHPSLITYH
jgi:hypothetical protein